MKKLEVDNFGLVGTQFLLAQIGIRKAPPDFCNRATLQIRTYIRENNEVLKGLTTADTLHKRVCSFAEYAFNFTDSSRGSLNGAMLRENGYWTASTTRGGKCRWLVAAKGLKAGAYVDRMLCSEFQTLEELCDALEREGATGSAEARQAVTGGVRLFVSTTPCISCVGAMSQFLLMFPAITMEVASGKIPIRQGWKKDAVSV